MALCTCGEPTHCILGGTLVLIYTKGCGDVCWLDGHLLLLKEGVEVSENTFLTLVIFLLKTF